MHAVWFTHHDEKRFISPVTPFWLSLYVKSLQRFKPEIGGTNTGYAVNDLYGPIIMGKEDTLRTRLRCCRLRPSWRLTWNQPIIALLPAELREFSLLEHGIEDKILIPADGNNGF